MVVYEWLHRYVGNSSFGNYVRKEFFGTSIASMSKLCPTDTYV